MLPTLAVVFLSTLFAVDPLTDLRHWIATPVENRPPLEREPFAIEPLTKERAKEAAELLWQQRVESLKRERQDEWTNKSITIDDKTMKFDFKTFGTPREHGRRLFISMHGGGSAPAEVNEQQWKNQVRLYTPQEGVYLAPRAPTDAWNMWHEAHIDGLFGRLIADAIIFENVDPERVYIMGYSAGGDGVYQLAPRMADRWAAAAMMAGHPNDASPLNLRNLPFTIHVGGNDNAFDRNKVGAEWGAKLDELQKADPEGYVHFTQIHEGKPHWMNREDAVAVPWMAEKTRVTWPKKITWRQDDVLSGRFYWLAVDKTKAKAGDTILATVDGNTITVQAPASVDGVSIILSDALVDLDQPLVVKVNERQVLKDVVPRTIAAMVECLAERSDPTSMGTARIRVEVK